jgi:hypothetical protein
VELHFTTSNPCKTFMSLLTFLGLRQPRYNRTPLTLADVLHRTLVTGLAALSIYGVYLGYSVHDHVMAKGKGVFRPRGSVRFPMLNFALFSSSCLHASAEVCVVCFHCGVQTGLKSR